jgi:hypothetical protein
MHMRKLFLILTIVVTAFLSIYVFSKDKPQNRQEVIKFSHKFHHEEVGAACLDCHAGAAESLSADDNLLVSKEECANCHDVEDESMCTQCHYEDEETMQALQPPVREIIFNHKFHLEEQNAACEVCHKNLTQVDYSDAHSLPAMADCAGCHDNQRASLECASCHTDVLTLRPVGHTADYIVSHKNIARLDQAECAMCHIENDCSACHEGAALLTFAGGNNLDVQTPLNVSASGAGTRGLILSRVHELNFRLTHPLQAQGRSTECAVCHETRSFCQDCHEAEGVDVAGKPIWHGGDDWGALAGVVGTGGGRHAQLAKRDIENCAGCHNTVGDDPSCLLCHMDADGVQGSDPKTHGSGFADKYGEGASFHHDDSAVCYACHTGTQQAGVGFCGYCHGPQ